MEVSGCGSRPRPRPALQAGTDGASQPWPADRFENRLLRLIDAWRRDPDSLPSATTREIESRLAGLERRLDAEAEDLSFSEARFIDRDTVCLVFTGRPRGLCSLPPQANLLVDQQWNLSGGIMFNGLHAEPLRP